MIRGTLPSAVVGPLVPHCPPRRRCSASPTSPAPALFRHPRCSGYLRGGPIARMGHPRKAGMGLAPELHLAFNLLIPPGVSAVLCESDRRERRPRVGRALTAVSPLS